MAPRTQIRTPMMWIAVLDLLCLVLGSIIGVFMCLGHEEVSQYVFDHVDGWLLLFGGVILANYLSGSYRVQHTYSRFNLLVTWLFSLLFASLILSITSFAWFSFIVGRGVLFFTLVSYSLMTLTLKMLVYKSMFRSEALLCRTVILGSGENAQAIRKEIESEFILPAHKVVAYIREKDCEKDLGDNVSLIDGVAVIEATRDTLEDVIRSLSVGLIVIALGEECDASVLYPSLRRLRFEGAEVLTPLNVSEIYSGRTPLGLIDEEYLMQLSMDSGFPAMRRLKRVVDILTSVLACIILLPLIVLTILAVKLTAPRSPVFYSQYRLGIAGDIFPILKFRTMCEDAEAATGPVWSGDYDSRVTLVGRVLRRFRLDEIPQFINVIRGEMSIVGPRPERPQLVEKLEKEIPFYAERENTTPGLTGWAQIRYPYGNSVEDSARKLEYDLYYMKHMSFSLDLQIVLSTLRIVIFGGK